MRGQLSPAEAQGCWGSPRAAAADGVAPLSEHVMLHLRTAAVARRRNLLMHGGGAIWPGTPTWTRPRPGEGPSGELVIHPGSPQAGAGPGAGPRALVAEAGGQPVRLWAHGDLPAAAGLAAAPGSAGARRCGRCGGRWRGPVIAPPKLAAGITVRTFVPGQDEDAWLAVNARAFAHHPEQGRLDPR